MGEPDLISPILRDRHVRFLQWIDIGSKSNRNRIENGSKSDRNRLGVSRECLCRSPKFGRFRNVSFRHSDEWSTTSTRLPETQPSWPILGQVCSGHCHSTMHAWCCEALEATLPWAPKSPQSAPEHTPKPHPGLCPEGVSPKKGSFSR